MRVEIAHDYLTQRGGAERVVLSMLDAFPQAHVHTLLYDPPGTFPEFSVARVRPSPLSRVGLLRHHHRLAFPMLAGAADRLHIDADVVVCSSSGWAHGVKAKGAKVVYCHSPARWLYQPEAYLRGAGAAARFAARALRPALTRWDRRRQSRGQAPFTLPLKVGTHSVTGFAALRVLAGLRWLRRSGVRFATEQALIERWLDSVVRGTHEAWAFGHEIALCGRLIKGYGGTNERGKANLLHVVDHLAAPSTAGSSPTARAEAIAAARTAALADEAGTALDQVLVRHGAPTRPLAESPIRFVRRAPTASQAAGAQTAPR